VFDNINCMSTADQILSARLTAAAQRNARDRTVTTDQAVAEIRELAGDRPDLLAQCAGLALGCGESLLDADVYRRAADLCILAGADESLMGDWIAVGRSRAAEATARPNTTGRRPYR
jgi:hypothetical protein